MSRATPPVALAPLARLRSDLAPLAAPVAPRLAPTSAAIGAVLAADLVAESAHPPSAVALLAGRAVASIETVGASPYGPATPNRLVPVTAGDPLPAGCDAVVPAEAVVDDFGLASVQQSVAPGDNVRRAGEDLAAGTRLAAAGTRLAASAALLAETIGIDSVAIRRPTVALATAPGSDADRGLCWLAAVLAHDGSSEAIVVPLADVAAGEADLRLLIGGPAIAEADPAVATLAAAGTILGHGLALTGLESLAWGSIEGRPALVLPGRPEALVLAALTVIAPLLADLAGAPDGGSVETRPLARKIVSRVGLTEIALLAREAESWRPLGCGDLSWGAVLSADAFLELPPESEGLAETTPLAARPLAQSILRSSR